LRIINQPEHEKLTIILKDDEPIYQKARRLSQAERDIVNDQIGEWEKQGMVRASTSDFASPIVLVRKKDGSHRLRGLQDA